MCIDNNNNNKMSLTAEAIAGALTGTTQTIIGHPFDTLKTLSQDKGRLVFTADPRVLFRGWYYPVLLRTGLSGIRFTGTKYFTGIFDNNYWIGGAIAGVLTSPIVNWVDLYKTHKQTTNKVNVLKINPLQGLHATAIRDFFGMSSFFGSYHFLKDQGLSNFHAGGLAGTFCWSFIYPFDTIKTRIQKEGIPIKNAIKRGNIYRGLPYQLTKIYIATGLGFMVNEYVLRSLRS